LTDAVNDAVTNLLVAAAALNAQVDGVCARFGVTASAFEVLRILRGEPEGQARGAIARRLKSRAPDVTRLIDRLERQGFVRRSRARSDRRLSLTRITPKGAELAARIEPVIDEYRARMMTKLSMAEWIELARLCQRIGTPKQSPRPAQE
jgi:DNA-binding MarR family transcriptional regulator